MRSYSAGVEHTIDPIGISILLRLLALLRLRRLVGFLLLHKALLLLYSSKDVVAFYKLGIILSSPLLLQLLILLQERSVFGPIETGSVIKSVEICGRC